MIVAQVVVVHLVSRSLRAVGVVNRVPFFTLSNLTPRSRSFASVSKQHGVSHPA